MKRKQLTFEDLESAPFTSSTIILNKEKLTQFLSEIISSNDSHLLKNKVQKLKDIIISPKNDEEGMLNIDLN